MDAEVLSLPQSWDEPDRRRTLLGMLKYAHDEAAAMQLGVTPALLAAAILEIEDACDRTARDGTG